MYIQVIIGGLISSAPAIVGWIIAVVLATIMLRRGGARAERFLLAGASLMLFAALVAVLTSALGMWLTIDKGMTNTQAALWLSIYGLVKGGIGLAGIICLVYAFWLKFKRTK